MSAYRVSRRAENDLNEIFEYISTDNPDAADELWLKFHDKFSRLVEFPLMGNRRDELCPSLRGLAVGQYIIFYRTAKAFDGIEIVRVLHGTRDLPNIIDS